MQRYGRDGVCIVSSADIVRGSEGGSPMRETTAKPKKPGSRVPVFHRSIWTVIAAVLVPISIAVASPLANAHTIVAGAATSWNEAAMQSSPSRGIEMTRLGGTADAEPERLQSTSDNHDEFWDGGWWVVMPIMMVIFWGGIIAVAMLGIRQFTRGRDRSPLDIAKERLAKGEISKEDFDRIRDDLA
jgi:putative membrane protein